MLGQYEANPQNWRSKDAALFLVTTLASRGSTLRHGTTKISELVNLEEFTSMHVLPELANPNSELKLYNAVYKFNAVYKLFVLLSYLIIINMYFMFIVNGIPVMKADAIKYIVTFRSVLPSQVIVSTLPALTQLLEADSVVVRIYAAAAIDKILLLKHPDTKASMLVFIYDTKIAQIILCFKTLN